MKKVVIGLLALVVTMGITGCAGKSESVNMVYHETQQYAATFQNAVNVDEVKGGEETNPLWTSEIGNGEFRDALEQTLKENGLFANNEVAQYYLRVSLLKVDQPLFGLDMKVTTEVRYELINAATGQVLLDKTYEASHTATFSDSAFGVKRLRLANEGSARENIGLFMDGLANLETAPQKIGLK